MKKLTIVFSWLFISASVFGVLACSSGSDTTSTSTPAPTAGGVIVSIATYEVAVGSDFTIRVNIGNVTNMDTYQFDLTYDSSIIQIIGAEGGATGVTPGLIGVTPIPVELWSYQPIGNLGKIRVIGNLPGITGVSGSGYLCEIHFHAVGVPCNTSTLAFSAGMLGNAVSQAIVPVIWINGSAHINEVLATPTPTAIPVTTATPS